jgi:hypothetical protein
MVKVTDPDVRRLPACAVTIFHGNSNSSLIFERTYVRPTGDQICSNDARRRTETSHLGVAPGWKNCA